MTTRPYALATLCTALLTAASAHAQLSTIWITQYGSSNSEEGMGIAIDSAGQAWIAGNSSGDLGGSGINGNADFILSRISPTGTVLSTAQRGSSGFDRLNAVALLGSTSIFTGGYTTGAPDGQTNAGSMDNAVLRYSSTGIWQNTIVTGSASIDTVLGLAANSANVFSVGYTDGSFASQTNAGIRDAVITKMDGAGVAIWTRFLGTSGSERGTGITVDIGGNSYATGSTSSTLTAAPSAGAVDIFVAKYDASGNPTLIVQRGTSAYDQAQAIKVDASGNIYLVGSTSGNLDGEIGNGAQDAFLTKLDSVGNLLWTRLFGGPGIDFGMALDLDSSGNPWIGGHSLESDDAFVAEYDTAGGLLGTQSFISPIGTQVLIHGLAAVPGGGVEVTGETNGNLGGPNAGGFDIFVAKVVPEPGVCGLLIGAIGGLGMRRVRGRRG